MKTLNEQINEVMTSKMSKSAKRQELVKIGIREADIERLFYIAKQNAPAQTRRQIEDICAKYTFGVEIECYNAPRTALLDAARRNRLAMQSENYNHTDNRRYYKLVSDASISGNDPVECVTPILNGSNTGFNSLKKACNVLNEVGAKVNKSTGLHIHVGGQITQQQYCNTFVNYFYLECVIDSFMAASRRDAFYASAMGSTHRRLVNITQLLDANTCNDVQRAFHFDRYYKINCMSYNRHRTIEFRQHSGTTNYEKIAMWARFCIKLVDWSATHRLSAPVTCIENIPFLTDDEKRFFTQRANDFARVTE